MGERTKGVVVRGRAHAPRLRPAPESAVEVERPAAPIAARGVATASLLALQRAAGNATVAAALAARRPVTVQRDEAPKKKGGFRPVDDKAAEEEFAKKVAAYVKAGKKEKEASFLAMDDMFADRVGEAGGKRLPKSATPTGKGDQTVLRVSSKITFEGTTIDPGIFNAAIDDGVYNCHSFTLDEGKKSKRAQLNGLARTVPKEAGDMAGKTYFEAEDLVKNGIHIVPEAPFGIFPSWVGDAEMRDRLKDFVKVTGKVKVGDIAVYSVGQALPHSGRVVAVATDGTPTMIKSKWGHQSLFEHPPAAVPAHYGTPEFFRKK